jgi:hypothetical protein
MLDFLTLPSLASLSVRGPEYHGPCHMAFSKLSDLISRSRCTLSSLHVDNVPIEDDAVITFLGLVPSLTDLTILQCDGMLYQYLVTDSLLRAMQFPKQRAKESTQPLLVPKLKRLSLKSSCQTFKPELLVDMVESRLGTSLESDDIECLQSIQLVILRDPCDNFNSYKALFSLGAGDLRVEVVIPDGVYP